MIAALTRLLRQLGAFGVGAIVVLVASTAAHVGLVMPLQETSQRIDQALQRASHGPVPHELKRVKAAPEAQLAAFYAFFERTETADLWLAKLYGIASAAGLELRTGDYRLADSRHRLERYHITLPVSGTYAQVRTFLEGALAEVPVVSLEHVNFRRREPSEPRIEAEIVLTLHLLPQ